MTRLVSHGPVRALLIVLLAWTCADGAFYGACSLDPVGTAPFAPLRLSTAPPPDSHPGPAQHADHCFCHAQWVGVVGPAVFAAPAGSSQLPMDLAREGPDGPSRDLDHPPQLLLR